jgi:hypothetical protein
MEYYSNNMSFPLQTYIIICVSFYTNLQNNLYLILVEDIPLCLKYINKKNYTCTQFDITI